MPVHALLLRSPNRSQHHAVLLRAAYCGDLALQTIAAHQARVVTAGEHQAIVRAQQDWRRHPPESFSSGEASLYFGRGAPAWPRPSVPEDPSAAARSDHVVLRLGTRGILHAALAVLDPAFDLRRGPIELPAGCGHCRLALDDLKDQRRLAPGGPALDPFFHHFAHQCLLRTKVTPEQEISGSLQSVADARRAKRRHRTVLRLEEKRPLPIQTGQPMDSRHALAEVGSSSVARVSHLVNLNAQLGCIDSCVLPNGDYSLNVQEPNQLNIDLARNRELMRGELPI